MEVGTKEKMTVAQVMSTVSGGNSRLLAGLSPGDIKAITAKGHFPAIPLEYPDRQWG